MSHNPDPNPAFCETLEPSAVLERFTGVHRLRPDQRMWSRKRTLAGIAFFLGFVLPLQVSKETWAAFSDAWGDMKAWSILFSAFGDIRFDPLMQICSYFAFFGVLGWCRTLRRKTITISSQGIGFNRAEVNYSADKILEVRIVGQQGVPIATQRKDVELVLGTPKRGLGRVMPWRREVVRFGLPNDVSDVVEASA